jgi:copper chaperone NosL
MRGAFIVIVLCLLFAGLARATETVEGPRACQQCGMDRGVFARSRALVTYSDGGSAATCSIHCAVEDIMSAGTRRVTALQVADYHSKELIDAKGAVWVVGGKKGGVMTSPAKWAFARAAEAAAFIKENGGSMTPYDQVLKAVQEEVEEMAKAPEME